jgi:hypothetical protein
MRIRPLLPAGLVLLLGLTSGCGGGRPVSTEGRSAPPHGGMMLTMPEEKGFVEIVTRAPARKGDTSAPEFAVYFLGPDRSTPLAAPPASATLTVTTPTGAEAVELKPMKDAFISQPGPSRLAGHELDGELAFDFEGKPVKLPLAGR